MSKPNTYISKTWAEVFEDIPAIVGIDKSILIGVCILFLVLLLFALAFGSEKNPPQAMNLPTQPVYDYGMNLAKDFCDNQEHRVFVRFVQIDNPYVAVVLCHAKNPERDTPYLVTLQKYKDL